MVGCRSLLYGLPLVSLARLSYARFLVWGVWGHMAPRTLPSRGMFYPTSRALFPYLSVLRFWNFHLVGPEIARSAIPVVQRLSGRAADRGLTAPIRSRRETLLCNAESSR
jgi:hypothetical protein